MQSVSDRYVTLHGGLTLPIEAVVLVLDLEARGFSLSRDRDSVVVQPASRLTDADRVALKRWRSHVLALIDYQPRDVQ